MEQKLRSAAGRLREGWRQTVMLWRHDKYKHYLRCSGLCFLLMLTFLLVPERYETVDLQPQTLDKISIFPLYEPHPGESIEQIRIDLVWSLRSKPVAPGDFLISLPNAGWGIKKQLLDQLNLPASTAGYYFKLNLYDDAAILRAAPVTADLNDDDLPILLYNVGHHRFIKPDMAQTLFVNNELIKVDQLQITRAVDRRLPKLVGALLAALGSGLLITYLLKRFGVGADSQLIQKLMPITVVLFTGLAASLAMCVYYRSWGAVDYPYGTFLYAAEDRFNDLFNTFTVMRFMADPYLEPIPGTGYFPLTYLVLKLVPSFNQWYVIYFSYSLFLSFYLVSAFAVCCRRGWVATGGLLSILLLNYPLWFMLDRGNIDFLVYLFIFLFVWCYRQKYDWLSILFLICAVNLKLYPAILAVLYLKDQKYKKFFAAALGSLAMFGLCLWYFDFNWRGFLDNLQRYQECYVYSLDGINCGHSLFGLFKLLMHVWGGVDQFAAYASAHTVLAMIAAALVSWYVIRFETVFWKKLYLLLAMMLLLPHTSLDYRMIVLVIPVLYFLTEESRDPHQWCYAIGWGLILMPIHWIGAIHGEPRQLSVLIRPLLLCAMALLIMFDGWHRRQTQSTVMISSSKSETGPLS